MAVRQTRVFVPRSDVYGGPYWAENLLGRVLKPLLLDHSEHLEWFWFSRYDVSPEADSGDCDISSVPAEFKRDGQLRSLRFRYGMADSLHAAFEQDGEKRIVREGCFISGWLDYPLADDLGGPRFIDERRGEERRKERSELVRDYLQSVSKLVLHGLIGPDERGQFHLEENTDKENPSGSSFDSMLHMFGNITDVSLRVELTIATRTLWRRSSMPACGAVSVKF